MDEQQGIGDQGATSIRLEPATVDLPTQTVVMRPEDALVSSPSFGRSPSDDYAICGKIGDGGMGVVYLARDRRLGRYVAIKRLNEKSLADPVLRTRFLHEARAVAALNHAYIVHIYALGEDALGPYIVMEYVSGPTQTEVVRPESGDEAPPKGVTLEEFINHQGPMTAEEAVTMILKVARTMVYAHSCGVIHRDLKPANILLDPSQEPKLVDFGLARITPREGGARVEELTVPGEKLISLGYSAPELEQDASTSDGRADIYSLGAILYFLLTGRNPRYYREQDVPAFLREVLRRSLETVREQRYRTAQDFVRALTEAASHGKTVAPTIKTTWRCKWCDAVNPISTKFCAECGWDGSERCLECSAETFVGQQYCPSCGADCRMYEHVASIVKLMAQAKEERRFERIASIAGRLHGFEPSGPTGRQILADARKCVEEAERSVARRNRLASLIPNELKAENYERAQNFIEEFRQLNEDPMVYEEELQNLPSLILARDLVRVRQCLRTKDWETARSLLDNMAAKYGNVPEYQDVKHRMEAHERKRRRLYWAGAFAGVFLLYVLSLPFVIKLMGGQLGRVSQTLYAPVHGLASLPGVKSLMNGYVGLFGQQPVAAYFVAPEGASGAMATHAAHARSPLPDNAEHLCSEFELSLEEIKEHQVGQELNLLEQYRQELSDYREKAQKAGDFDGVEAALRAQEEYHKTGQLGTLTEDDPEKLSILKDRFAHTLIEQKIYFARKIVSASKRYTSALDEMLKQYTQRDEMEKARTIREEIKRVQQLTLVVDAEKLLAQSSKTGSGVVILSAPEGAAVVSPQELGLNTKYAEMIKTVDAQDAVMAAALSGWKKQYIARLSTLLETLEQQGDFNGWEATSEEVYRFEEEGTLSENNLVEYPKDLHQVQEIFIKHHREIVVQSEAAKLTAFQAYIAELETLKSELTKKNQLEAASTVNQALRMVRKDPQYTALVGGKNRSARRTKAAVVPTSTPVSSTSSPSAVKE